jgi:hypothetical protein
MNQRDRNLIIFVIIAILCLWLLIVSMDKSHAADAPLEPLTCDREVDARTPFMERVASIADAYWLTRGYGPQPALRVCMVGNGTGAAGWGQVPGNTVWLPESTFHKLEQGSHAARKDGRVTMCQIMVHERGHNFGLTHADPHWSIMNPSLGTDGQVVGNCAAWAKRPWAPRWQPFWQPPMVTYQSA